MIFKLKGCKQNILVATLLSVMITYCLSPFLQNIAYSFYKTKEIEIVNLTPDPGRGTEIWIAETEDMINFYNLQEVVDEERLKGSTEYRKKEDYGYGYNFLVSYGENIGSQIIIAAKADPQLKLTFWKNPMGGKVQIITEDYKQILDLYAPVDNGGEIVSIPLGIEGNVNTLIKLIIYSISFISFATIIYYVIPFLLRGKKPLIAVEEQRFVKDVRIDGIDFVRAIAVIFVVAVHFFLGSNYYNTPLDGTTMFVMTGVRWLFLTCVPLFMILTGFLKRNKVFNYKHYVTLIPILITYVLIVILKFVIDRFYFHQPIGLMEGISSILKFEYSWYVNMYIGVFLLIPFLNTIWNKLETIRYRQMFLLIMIGLTSFSTITNNLITNYWSCLFPFTYYFLGTYLKDYKVKVNKGLNITMIIGIILLQTLYTFGMCQGKIFDWMLFGGYNCAYNAFPTMVLTFLIFILIYNTNIKSKALKFISKKISTYSLEIYLLSSLIVDNLIYPKLRMNGLTFEKFTPYLVLIVICSVLGSFVLGILIKLIVIQLERVFKYLVKG